jgi:hypothetical protein
VPIFDPVVDLGWIRSAGDTRLGECQIRLQGLLRASSKSELHDVIEGREHHE